MKSFRFLFLIGYLFSQYAPVTEASSAGAAAWKAMGEMDYRYFVAGGTCAAISHGITTPIDVVKTRIQANPKVSDSGLNGLLAASISHLGSQKYRKGMLAATAKIVKREGAGALLSGLGPTVVGYGIEGAMKFGVYEVAKPVLAALLHENTALAFVLASSLAGAIAALLLCPMESLRIRQVTDSRFANESLLTGLTKLIQQEGVTSLFGGVWAMLAKQVPYTFGKQVSFDVIASALYTILARVTEVVNKWLVSISAAFCASIVACILSQPGDMILTETYKGSKPGSFSTVLQTLYQRGGLAEFFRGTGARIVHVGMIITSQLVIYDIVKQLLGLPATGSH